MLPETESALAGFSRGAVQGAALAFIVVGAIGALVAVSTGGVGLFIGGGPVVAFIEAMGAFLLAGACGAPFGAAAGACYEGYNEFLEEREVQRHMKHAKEVTHNSELVDIMHVTEKLTPSFEETMAASPPPEEVSRGRREPAVERLNRQRSETSGTAQVQGM